MAWIPDKRHTKHITFVDAAVAEALLHRTPLELEVFRVELTLHAWSPTSGLRSSVGSEITQGRVDEDISPKARLRLEHVLS